VVAVDVGTPATFWAIIIVTVCRYCWSCANLALEFHPTAIISPKNFSPPHSIKKGKN